MRRRYFVMVSAAYVLLGMVILVRSVTSHVLPLVALGVIFIALGVVRLRDYRRSISG